MVGNLINSAPTRSTIDVRFIKMTKTNDLKGHLPNLMKVSKTNVEERVKGSGTTKDLHT